MSQDNSAATIKEPELARNLLRWVSKRRVRAKMRSVDLTKPAAAKRELLNLVTKEARLFKEDRRIGKTSAEIVTSYYNLLTAYASRR